MEKRERKKSKLFFHFQNDSLDSAWPTVCAHKYLFNELINE